MSDPNPESPAEVCGATAHLGNDRRMAARRRVRANSVRRGECWEWTGTIVHGGYGRTCFMGRYFRAHRLSFEAFNGPAGELLVCHKCDNPWCVNPEHLFLGTLSDNMRDMIAKGRHGGTRKGEANGRSVLTVEQILHIRGIGHSRSGCSIAREFGVSSTTIYKILKGRRWQHVPPPPIDPEATVKKGGG